GRVRELEVELHLAAQGNAADSRRVGLEPGVTAQPGERIVRAAGEPAGEAREGRVARVPLPAGGGESEAAGGGAIDAHAHTRTAPVDARREALEIRPVLGAREARAAELERAGELPMRAAPGQRLIERAARHELRAHDTAG